MNILTIFFNISCWSILSLSFFLWISFANLSASSCNNPCQSFVNKAVSSQPIRNTIWHYIYTYINLLCPCFFLFGIQELLRDTTSIVLCTDKKRPKLLHKLHSVFLHKSSKRNLNFLPIHYLQIVAHICSSNNITINRKCTNLGLSYQQVLTINHQTRVTRLSYQLTSGWILAMSTFNFMGSHTVHHHY